MHEPPGPDDLTAEIVADRLVPETDAQDGFLPGKGLDDIEGYAGFPGGTWPRRKQDAIGFQGERLLRVISLLRKTRCSTPSWPKYWTRLKVNESKLSMTSSTRQFTHRNGEGSSARSVSDRALRMMPVITE